MPFVMTEKNDEVDVKFKVDEGEFTIRVGTIPAVIGQQIDVLMGKTMALFRNAMTSESDKIDVETIEAQHSAKEAMALLCKYGVRGHSGIKNSKGDDILCDVIAEDGTDFKILSPETLELYVGNARFLKTVDSKLSILRRVGIARYSVEGDKCLDEARKQGEKDAAPFTRELEESLKNSTDSAEKSDTAS